MHNHQPGEILDIYKIILMLYLIWKKSEKGMSSGMPMQFTKIILHLFWILAGIIQIEIVMKGLKGRSPDHKPSDTPASVHLSPCCMSTNTMVPPNNPQQPNTLTHHASVLSLIPHTYHSTKPHQPTLTTHWTDLPTWPLLQF